MNDKLREAEKLLKEATKLTTPSVLTLRLKPEWETATPLFERAAMLFKTCGDNERAKTCYERAAIGQERQKSGWHAAKDMEKAGEIAKEMGRLDDVEACYSRAAEYYAEEGRQVAAAEAAGRGARALEEKRPEAATALYRKAVAWMEESDRDALASDIFRQAIAHLVRQQQWSDAVAMLMRFAAACDACSARNSECKAYLGAVVVWLYAEQASSAWATYQDALGVDAFMSSDEAFAADALFDAYRTADPGVVAETVKRNQVFVHLDNQLARLAKKLPQGDLAAQAAALGGDGGALPAGEGGEEDLT